VEGHAVRPRDAVTLDLAAADHPTVLAALAPRLAGLVPAPSRSRPALRVLGVRQLSLADVVDGLPLLDDAEEWRALYDGLAPLADDARARESMGALPVPLADGRVVRGPRGLLLPADAAVPAEALAALAPHGLRLVDPSAAHPLLERLGAGRVTARSVLDHPAVRTAVAGSADADEPEELAQAILALVRAALAEGSLEPGGLPWLADLALTDHEGDLAPAGALVLPGSFAAQVLDPQTVGRPADRYVEQWDRTVLAAVGVLDGLALLREGDVDLDEPSDQLIELDRWDDWVDELDRLRDGDDDAPTGTVAELAAVRDLDLVTPDRWPEVLSHVASSPVLRRALVDPVAVVSADGQRSLVRSYTAWWLRDELHLAGALDPAGQPSPGTGLAELLDVAPTWLAELDDEVRGALGLVGGGGVGAMSADPKVVDLLLERLADPARDLGVSTCLAAWQLLGEAGADEVAPQPTVRALVAADDGTLTTRVLDRDETVVVDDPRWVQRTDLGGLVVVPAASSVAVADLLDLPLASDVALGRVSSDGALVEVPTGVRDVLVRHCLEPVHRWFEHEELVVDGVAVDWWVEDGVPHAATTDGLARALAWTVGAWPLRHVLGEVLSYPASAQQLLLEDASG
jgi:hypothetical protein